MAVYLRGSAAQAVKKGSQAGTAYYQNGGGGGGGALQDLTLSAFNIAQGAKAGTVVGTIGNKSSGTYIMVRGASGRVVCNSDYTQLIVGMTATTAPFSVTLREVRGVEYHDTVIPLTTSSLTPITDPMAAPEAPVGIYGLLKDVAAYAGNCCSLRDSSNTSRTAGWASGAIDTSSFGSWGDGVTFGVTTLNEQSTGIANRNLAFAGRIPLIFPGNFATLVTTPPITNGGSGHTAGTVLDVQGGMLADTGGQTAQLTIDTVDGGGAITAWHISRAGKYKYSPSGTTNAAANVTGGTGTGATSIIALTKDSGNNYAQVPLLDANAAAIGGATTDAFLNVGGTVNLAVFLVCARYGYGNQYTSRPGTPSTTASTALVGYGTAGTGVLIGGAPLAATNSGSQTDPVSFNVNKDSLGRSASVYNRPEWMPLDESAPSATAGFTNVWFNQKGAVVTAGGDTRRHWSDRLHGVTAASAQKLVLGGAGSGAGANAGIRSLWVYQPTTAFNDDVAHAIALGQRQKYSVSVDTVIGPRIVGFFTGQSYPNSELGDSESGDGTAGSKAAERRWKAKLATYLGINSERISFGYASRTAVGGTPTLKRPMPGDADNVSYWWDEDLGGFGNLWTTSFSGAGNTKGYLDAIMFGVMYKNAIIVDGQGQADSTGVLTPTRQSQWAQQRYLFIDAFRNYIGQPNAPCVLQVISRYNSTPDQQVRVNNMRRLQATYIGAQKNVFLAADTGHLARAVTVVYDAHLGSMTDFDATTGTAEDGYQRAAWQEAKASAHAMRMVYGMDVVANDNWRGPEFVEAWKTAANKLFFPATFPYGCAGTDLQSPSGQFSGARVVVSGSDYLTTGGVKTTYKGRVGIEYTFAAADIPLSSPAYYEPNYCSGPSQGNNVRNQVTDNNSELPLPVATSPAAISVIDLAAA